MKKLILLLGKIYLLLLFIVFETAAIVSYTHSTHFTQARLLAVSNSVFGWGHGAVSGVKGYFGLHGENKRLAAENAELRNQLEHFRRAGDSIAPHGDYPFFFSSATVVNNSISQQRNYITLDKGTLDGVKPDMAVTTPSGEIAGYVVECSDKFAVCISVLNTEFRASGRIKGTDSYGPILWDGTSSEYITLTDIPKYTEIRPGDTVLTTNFSSIFPPDMMIGTIEDYKLNQSMLYEARVRLSARMASLRHVLLISYTDLEERSQLEERVHTQQ